MRLTNVLLIFFVILFSVGT